jgi:hypothetical protein
LLLGLFFVLEDEGDMFLPNVVDSQWTTLHHIPEERTLHNNRCENIKFQNKSLDLTTIFYDLFSGLGLFNDALSSTLII